MRRLLKEMFLQPASALASAAQMLTQRVGRGMQVDAVVSRMARALGRTPAGADEYAPLFTATDYGDDFAEPTRSARRDVEATDVEPEHFQTGEAGATQMRAAPAVGVTQMAAANTNAEERKEMDKDLRDDMLKLVRYKVLFVKREYEHAFPEQEDLVSDNMDGSAFTAWKIAEFIQQLGRGETAVPHKWNEKGYPSATYRRDGALLGLDEEDKKYLRVYFEVLERYPREKFKYEEQQVRVLEQIRDKL
jgi:hypothetical protein